MTSSEVPIDAVRMMREASLMLSILCNHGADVAWHRVEARRLAREIDTMVGVDPHLAEAGRTQRPSEPPLDPPVPGGKSWRLEALSTIAGIRRDGEPPVSEPCGIAESAIDALDQRESHMRAWADQVCAASDFITQHGRLAQGLHELAVVEREIRALVDQ